MIGLLVVLLVGAGKAKPPPKPPTPAPAAQKAAPKAEPKPEAKAEEPGPPADPWEFDGLTALVKAAAQPADDLSTLALTQLNVPLEGNAQFKVSAHANTVGGVTLALEDPNDAKTACALYAAREGDVLVIKDSRCSFFVFQGQARTQAVCRKINGTAKRANEVVHLEATSPDCSASPMGVPLSVRASVKPVIR